MRWKRRQMRRLCVSSPGSNVSCKRVGGRHRGGVTHVGEKTAVPEMRLIAVKIKCVCRIENFTLEE